MNITTKGQELVIQGPSIESRYLGPQEVATYHFIINQLFVQEPNYVP